MPKRSSEVWGSIEDKLNNQLVQTERGCLEWQGARTTGGYGLIRWDGKMHYAHRVAWECSNGPIPEGLCVLHKCDVRCCCTPEHLFLGTTQDNVDDMIAKGRYRHEPCVGRYNGSAVLTEAEVRQIRELLKEGWLTQRDIGHEFGVHECTISAIKYGRIWKRLQ